MSNHLTSSLPPIFVAAVGVAFTVVMDVSMRLLVNDYPLPQASAMRSLVMLGVATLCFLCRPFRPTFPTLRANVFRGMLFAVASLAAFAALPLLPLTTFYAVTYLEPFFIAFLVWLLLGEHPTSRVLLGMAIALFGVGAAILPDLLGETAGGTLLGVVLVVSASLLVALAIVVVRARANRDTPIQMLMIQTVAMVIVLVPVSLPFWVPINNGDIPLIVSAGLCAMASHFCMIWALTRTTAARVAVVDYSALIWAALAGYLVFSEVPTLMTVTGAVVIVLGCLFALAPSRTTALGRATGRGTAAVAKRSEKRINNDE